LIYRRRSNASANLPPHAFDTSLPYVQENAPPVPLKAPIAGGIFVKKPELLASKKISVTNPGNVVFIF